MYDDSSFTIGKTTIKIESIQREEKAETYAIIDIILYEGFESTLHFKECSKKY